ncbi:hypothetical protein [Fusobacterium ulcerans]|uniref:hypothetical protein n=1 Tax=Fusobacterium ulcerans TaxID=861 RepID=UPI003FEDF75F
MEDKIMENFSNFLNKLSEVYKKENSEKETAKVVVDDIYEGDAKKVIENFYRDIILPVEDKLELMLPKFSYAKLLLRTLLINGVDLRMDLEEEITKHNKGCYCCADESRTVINGLIKLLTTGEYSSLQETYGDYWKIIKDKEEKERLKDWEANDRLTYWSCKRFKNTKEVFDWILEKYYKIGKQEG